LFLGCATLRLQRCAHQTRPPSIVKELQWLPIPEEGMALAMLTDAEGGQ
jgi:hypothetical protein